eukprot:scaffold90490_cov60-Phaeocystis_antarctica.AAC.2
MYPRPPPGAPRAAPMATAPTEMGFLPGSWSPSLPSGRCAIPTRRTYALRCHSFTHSLTHLATRLQRGLRPHCWGHLRLLALEEEAAASRHVKSGHSRIHRVQQKHTCRGVKQNAVAALVVPQQPWPPAVRP